MNYRCLVFLLLLALAACDAPPDSGEKSLATLSGPDIERRQDAALIQRGNTLFQQHCAGCHGQHAEGDPNWRHRLADGTYPPPPLNGRGHAWHHSRETLHEMIRDGSQPSGDGEPLGHMPAWRDKLSSADIEALIAWFQSLWPDQVYAIWYDQQVRARGEQ